MKSEGFVETPQDIMEEYNGYSVPQYTRYPFLIVRGIQFASESLFSQ